jgi:hypothetical protein
MLKEEFNTIPNWNYMISDCGRKVKSINRTEQIKTKNQYTKFECTRVRKWRLMKVSRDKWWYLYVELKRKWEWKKFRLHHLQISSRIGYDPMEMKWNIVMHLNDIRDDNRYENLKLWSLDENNKDMARKWRSARWEKNNHNVIQETDIPTIRQLIKEGLTLKAIGEQYWVTKTAIWAIKQWKTWAWLTKW